MKMPENSVIGLLASGDYRYLDLCLLARMNYILPKWSKHPSRDVFAYVVSMYEVLSFSNRIGLIDSSIPAAFEQTMHRMEDELESYEYDPEQPEEDWYKVDPDVWMTVGNWLLGRSHRIVHSTRQ